MCNQGVRFSLKPIVVACVWGMSAVSAQAAEPSMVVTSQKPSGETITLDTVVITASQREQAIKDAPASIAVITRKEIEAKPYTSVTDVLRTVEGVSIVGASPNDQDISLRGMPGEYTLILIDGKRQNTRETMNRGTGGVQSQLLPPLNAIQRIEVVRGPMSSLYGADAMGGVINIITRKVPDAWHGAMTVGGVWQQEEGQGNSRSVDFWLGGPLKDEVLGLQISGKVFDRSEDDIFYPANSTSGANGQRNNTLDVKLVAKPASDQDVTLNVGAEQLTYYSTPGLSAAELTPQTASTATVKTRHEREYWSLSHEGRWNFGKSTLAVHGERGTQKQWTSVGQSPIEPVIRNTVFDGKVMIPWASDSNMLTLGGQYIWSHLSGAGKQDAVPKGYAVNSDSIRNHSWALFGENAYYANEKLTVTTGLRLDDDERYGSHVSPRLYGVYKLSPQLTLRGGVATGFKAPSLRQSTAGYCMTTGGPAGATPGTLCGNPDLKPETSVTEELGIRYDMNDGFAGVTLFNNLFKEKVSSYDTGVADPNTAGRNIYKYYNIGRVKLYGLELTGGMRLLPTVKLSGNYSLTYSRREGSGETAFNGGSLNGYPIENTPKHKLSVQADWSPVAQWNFYTAANYSSKQYWAAFRNGAVGVRERSGVTTYDLGGKWAVSKNLDVNFAVLNLTNKMIAVDERSRFAGLDGNWMVDEGRRLAASVSARF
ncbi:TonB-dependent receptor [Chitinivorax sp. B]|uniref:TonB-dependent receptor domain-containing protein n=1 Tax=Chitinivorax sp. B TaxID=2502235 RepID=UPI0010F640F6|nr:TonB-dependent receptor [Chitinivorax sp. B]